MKGVSVLFFLGLCICWSQGIFLNHRPFPTYSLENMPQTSFSCREKILGGYYADVDTQCQMFHICVKVAGIGIQDFRFLCPNGTAFDQDHQICAEWEDIDCDASTLYYSSDNFDLYRLGSGFESKALKYGEEEEPFALQRAETGDARINREQQARIVDQKKAPRNYNPPRQNNNNNEKEIFKGSSSANFYNNRNNGKERDEDYDDNVNINQNQDYEHTRKVVKNKSRRPIQTNQNDYNRNTQQNAQNSNRNRNTDHTRKQNNDNSRIQNDNRNQNTDYNKNQNTDYNRNQNTENNRNQNTDYNRNQNNDYNRNQNTDYNRNQNTDYNRNQNTDYNRNQNTDYNRNQNTQQPVAQTRRPATKFTGFINNFAGSYEPTTSKPTSTTLNSDQYTTAINNYKNRNGQRQSQQDFTDSPVYTISTPAPFRHQSQQQYNPPPTRTTNNNGQYYSSTSAPQKYTENSSKRIDDHFDIAKINSNTSTTQNYNTQYEIRKTKPANNNNNGQYDNQKTTVSQYETTKVKQNFNFKTTVSDKTENYPSNNPRYTSSFDKKQATSYKQNDNYPTTLSPKPFSLNNNNNNFPTTFAPRTNAAYSQIAQQTATYNQNRNTQNSHSPSTAYSSTPKSTQFTHYTPTVPKFSSTTPVSRSQYRLSKADDSKLDIKLLRSSRFDETQYDDGSYSSKYDYDGDKRDDEFLKTAHSQNIAASRNELSRTTKAQSTTHHQQQPQKSTYDFSKTFSSTTKQVSKATEPPKTNAAPEKKVPLSLPKKTKDVSYDYAYYDTNVGSEPDYDVDTEIKKSTVKN